MKQLNSFTVLNVNGADRISYTYSETNEQGEPISTNSKRSFFIGDADVLRQVNQIREYIQKKLEETE